jgi:hypothetical protein
VCIIWCPNTNVTPFVFPAPWTLIAEMGNSSMSMAIGVAVCTSSGMTMPDITWSGNSSVNAYVAQYTGNITSPEYGAFNENDNAGAATSPATNPGLNTTAANSLVINAIVGASAGASGTPSGYNLEVATTTDHMQLSDVTVAVAGAASPAMSEALGSSTAWATMQVEILSTAPPVANTKRNFAVNAGL